MLVHSAPQTATMIFAFSSVHIYPSSMIKMPDRSRCIHSRFDRLTFLASFWLKTQNSLITKAYDIAQPLTFGTYKYCDGSRTTNFSCKYEANKKSSLLTESASPPAGESSKQASSPAASFLSQIAKLLKKISLKLHKLCTKNS